MHLVVDNTQNLRDATISRETRNKLAETADALRMLAAVQDEIRKVDHGDLSLTGLGAAVAKHLRGTDPWETRELAQTVDETVTLWDDNGATEIRLLPGGGFEDVS